MSELSIIPSLGFQLGREVLKTIHITQGSRPSLPHPSLHYGSRHLTLVLQSYCKQDGDVEGIYSHNSNYSEYGFELKKNSFFTTNMYEYVLQIVLLHGFHKE